MFAFSISDRKRKWWILAAMGASLGVVVLDEIVVGVAMPTIQKELHMSTAGVHWVMNVYMLAFTCFVAMAGRLSDAFEVRNVYLTGLTIFALASLASGLAMSGSWIITARAIQGMGAAVMFPNGMLMLAQAFPPEKRGIAFGTQTACGGIFMALAPLIGGFFTHVVSWRWVFFVNLPFTVLIAACVLLAWTPRTSGKPGLRLDLPGFLTLLLGLSGLVVGTMQGADWGWSAPATLILLIGGAVLIAAFVLIETRKSDPLLSLGLFRSPTFGASDLFVFTGKFNSMSVVVFAAIYLQKGLGMGALETGYAMLAAVAPLPFSSLLAGRLGDKFGTRWPVILGSLLMGAGMLWIGVAVSLGKSYVSLVPGLVAWGLTLPFFMALPRREVMNTVPQPLQGQAGGINVTTQFFGGTVGVAVCGALLLETGTYSIVYYASAVLTAATLLAGVLFLDRQKTPGQPGATGGDTTAISNG